MARETILAEQKLTFAEDSDIGLYFWNSELIFTLTAGEAYTIVWGETEYSCIAEEMELDGLTGIGLGNKAIVGIGDDTGEPFIWAYLPDHLMNACYTTSTETSHTVTIYQGEEEDETPSGIILKDRLGEDVVHSGVKTVVIDHTDGTPRNFRKVEIKDLTIDPDFSSGDIVVDPEDDTVYSKVTVTKPENLKPENIPEGINIAGIDGTRGDGAKNISTEAEMNALLISKNVGNVYRFVGETTTNYVNGDIYIVEEVE